MRYKWWLIWLYGLFSLPLMAQVDKGTLSLNIAVTDTLVANEGHQYQLPERLEGFITLEIEAEMPVYSYLETGDSHLLEPLAINFSGNLLTQVYRLQGNAPYRVSIEGSGGYTVRLSRGDAIQTDVGHLATGDDVRGRLDTLSSLRYALIVETTEIITIEVINNRRSITFQVFDAQDAVYHPVAERLIMDRLLRVYKLDRAQRYTLKLYGLGDYRLRVYDEDLLREFAGEIKLDEPSSGNAVQERSLIYRITNAEEGVVSVRIEGAAEGVILRDSTGQRIDEQKHFREAGVYTVVFALSGQFPYEIELFARGSYTLTVLEGDSSLVTEQILFANDVYYTPLLPGRTPVYLLEIPENTEILLTLVLYGGVIYNTAPLLISADGVETTAQFLPLTANRLRLSVVPKGKSPYQFVPHITGSHVVSLVTTGVLPEKALRIRLTTDNTNLRSGATLDAPVLREGAIGTELLAVARNDHGDWLLALTGDGVMVWVFRQLVIPVDATKELLDLPFARRFAPPEPTSTPTLIATNTPDTSQTPMVMSLATQLPTETTPVPTASYTPTPLPETICTISSGGGVNIRLGPGTQYAASGALTAGQIRGVVGQAADDENQTWWQLADATWVRSDLVQEIGNCDSAPTIEVPE